jgi:hypothetical protein
MIKTYWLEDGLRVKLLAKPEFERQVPPQNAPDGRRGWWKSKTISAEIMEVVKLTP